MVNLNDKLEARWNEHLEDWLAGKCRLMSFVDFAAKFFVEEMVSSLLEAFEKDATK